MGEEQLSHPFDPVFDENSRMLILGSFPSVKSREDGFYYAHPRNRFWRILSDWAGEDAGSSREEKTAFLQKHGIALFDVLASCRIRGSSDASIREAVPNDLGAILRTAPIGMILLNGNTAGQCYRRYQEKLLGRQGMILPSTSPANAAWSLERLEEVWFAALDGRLE